MKRLLLLLIMLIYSGCAPYTLVKPEPHEIRGITITPTNAKWNKVTYTNPTTWTADGVMLNSIVFFAGVKDGEPLFKTAKQEQYPVYTTDMLPNEIMELVESTVAKHYGATISSSGNLKPVMIDNNPGFQFTIDFLTQDSIPRRAYIAGASKSGLLYLIFYQATSLYYFDKYLADIMAMVGTARLP